MTTKDEALKAVSVLRQHNEWRCDSTGRIKWQRPMDITKAIEDACRYIESTVQPGVPENVRSAAQYFKSEGGHIGGLGGSRAANILWDYINDVLASPSPAAAAQPAAVEDEHAKTRCAYQRGTVECTGTGLLWDADNDGWSEDFNEGPCPACNTAQYLTDAKEKAESTVAFSSMGIHGTGLSIWLNACAEALHENRPAAVSALHSIGTVNCAVEVGTLTCTFPMSFSESAQSVVMRSLPYAEDESRAALPAQPVADDAVRVCPEKDTVCGERPAGWCSPCPKRGAMSQPAGHSGDAKDAGWRPIETAPKDGTEILLCSGKDRAIASGCWMIHGGHWAWPYLQIQPKHWMPLPQPPAMSQERSNGFR